jgi:hypothetical protein
MELLPTPGMWMMVLLLVLLMALLPHLQGGLQQAHHLLGLQAGGRLGAEHTRRIPVLVLPLRSRPIRHLQAMEGGAVSYSWQDVGAQLLHLVWPLTKCFR